MELPFQIYLWVNGQERTLNISTLLDSLLAPHTATTIQPDHPQHVTGNKRMMLKNNWTKFNILNKHEGIKETQAPHTAVSYALDN